MTGATETGKPISIILFNCKTEGKPTTITSAMDLSSFSFIQRGNAKEIVLFCSREVVGLTRVGERLAVKHDKIQMDFYCHTYVNSERLGGAVITQGVYNQRITFALLNKAMELAKQQLGASLLAESKDVQLNCPGLQELLLKFQKPEEADAMAKIMKDLEETRNIMLQNIDKILERGEKIENLVERTNDLSTSSKMFVKQAEKLNRCCIII